MFFYLISHFPWNLFKLKLERYFSTVTYLYVAVFKAAFVGARLV